MKKLLSVLISTVMCLSLCLSGISSAYADEVVETGQSDFIDYDPDEATTLLADSSTDSTEYEYCQNYFYQQLDATNKVCYDAFCESWLTPTENMLSISTKSVATEYVTVSSKSQSNWTDDEETEVVNLAVKTFSSGLTVVLLDHPEIFWLDVNSIKYSYGFSLKRASNGYKVYITSVYVRPAIASNFTSGYDDDGDELSNALLAYDEFYNTYNNVEISGTTDYEKLKSIYAYVAEAAYYEVSTEYVVSTAGSVLLEPHKTVCEGYSNAIKLLCDREEIPCVTVGGNFKASTNTGHAWNEVCIEGKWYGIDITWDDTDDENILKYSYFLKGATSFSSSHVPGSVYTYIELDYPTLCEDDYSVSDSSETTDTTEESTEVTTESTTEVTTTTTTTEVTTITKKTTDAVTTTTKSTTTTEKATEVTTTILPATTTIESTTTIPVTTKAITAEVTTTATTVTTIATTITTTTTAITTIPVTTTAESTTEVTTVITTETVIITLLYGDVNADGNVSISDVVTLNKYLVGNLELNDSGKINANCHNPDTTDVDVNDSVTLLEYLVLAVESLPVIE